MEIISFLFLICVTGVGGFLLIWSLATMNIFFGFIKEGRGIIIKRGESYVGPIISFHEHHLVPVIRNGRERLEIVELKPGESPNIPGGVLGLLQEKFGIFWLGTFPPFRSIMEYRFRWNKWREEKGTDGHFHWSLEHREEPTTFFYAQTFPYALMLEGAETGGKYTDIETGEKSALGGNVEVDLEIVLLVKIICPEAAIIHHENWFDQLGALVTDQSRLFVGSRTFEELRSQKVHEIPTEGAPTKRTHNEFCEYIMELNEHAPIGETSDSIVDVYGVKIVGAHILDVVLAGESKNIAAATTAIYVAEQEAQARQVNVDAEAYGIRAKGNAEADAIKARTKAVLDFGADGKYVLRQEAIKEAGKGGNVVIFTNDNETSGDALLSRLIVPQQLKKKTKEAV